MTSCKELNIAWVTDHCFCRMLQCIFKSSNHRDKHCCDQNFWKTTTTKPNKQLFTNTFTTATSPSEWPVFFHRLPASCAIHHKKSAQRNCLCQATTHSIPAWCQTTAHSIPAWCQTTAHSIPAWCQTTAHSIPAWCQTTAHSIPAWCQTTAHSIPAWCQATAHSMLYLMPGNSTQYAVLDARQQHTAYLLDARQQHTICCA